ncbi:hypothetical protein M231_04504 [Tremella mesenterica]|uniref:Uncharacterized protein n=1 Tax=Tremella mesenterica TaxID=5217 RepID=A0A4Q1BKN5_TREME|nr:hypothetical protein M231_04504 [Tremella mesenterica]
MTTVPSTNLTNDVDSSAAVPDSGIGFPHSQSDFTQMEETPNSGDILKDDASDAKRKILVYSAADLLWIYKHNPLCTLCSDATRVTALIEIIGNSDKTTGRLKADDKRASYHASLSAGGLIASPPAVSTRAASPHSTHYRFPQLAGMTSGKASDSAIKSWRSGGSSGSGDRKARGMGNA